jgi:two-component system, NarL family, sensor histidine kinase UhpB
MSSETDIILFAVFSVTIVIIGLFSFFVVMMIRSHRKVEQAQQERIRQMQLFSEKLQAAREEEQKRIARELHDELGGALTGMKYDIHWLASHTSKRGEIPKRYAALKELIDVTTKTVQRISADLRPKILDTFGLSAAVEWHVGEFKKRTGIGVQFHASTKLPPFDDAITTGVYRIIQEALTNVARHSHATAVVVTLQFQNDMLHGEITDNGQGFDQALLHHPESLGLLSMQERARIIHGTVAISGSPGNGTRVTLDVPLQHTVKLPDKREQV